MFIEVVEHIDDWSWVEGDVLLGIEIVGRDVVGEFINGDLDNSADFFIVSVVYFFRGDVECLISYVVQVINSNLNAKVLKGNPWFQVIGYSNIEL